MRRGETQRLSSRRGAAGAAASPLVKPDVRISRIRLTRKHSLMNMHKNVSCLDHQPVATSDAGLSPLWAEAKAEQASSCATSLRQGPFAPRELPRFVATMNPSDSRPGQAAVMDSGSLVRAFPTEGPPPGRVSQVPAWSVVARRPLSPRGTPSPHVLVAGRPMTGFTISGGLAVPISVTRPKQVHLRYG